MSVNPIKNDKSTSKDELILSIITLIVIGIGLVLVILRPEVSFIKSNISLGFGIAMLLLGTMYIPCIIYRLMTNSKQ